MGLTKAVIIAAGEGNRMRPLTYSRPKVMLPIANKPILEHLLIELKQVGVREFFFVVARRDRGAGSSASERATALPQWSA